MEVGKGTGKLGVERRIFVRDDFGRKSGFKRPSIPRDSAQPPHQAALEALAGVSTSRVIRLTIFGVRPWCCLTNARALRQSLLGAIRPTRRTVH
jgi:hypothetical protein